MNKYSQKIAYILLLGSVLANPHSVLAADATVDPAFAGSVMTAQKGGICSIAVNELTPADPADARYTTTRIVTAYSSTPDQTDATPFITANGTTVHDGIIAANWLKFGTRVRIPDMFGDKVFIPAGWKGEMPNGDAMDANSTFASIRTKYTKDPDWAKVEAHLRGGPAPTFTYHRFWAQADIALANATFAILYPDGIKAGAVAAEPTAGGKGKPAKGAKGKGRKK